MQSLREIRALMAQAGHRPDKRMGQHFLHDANPMRRIVEAAEPLAQRRVLEVGPGTGALTERLLEAGASVVAVEADAALVSVLRGRFRDTPELAVLEGDVLARKSALNPAVREALRAAPEAPPGPFSLVANLPYQVASPLLLTLAEGEPGLESAVVLVQREVAMRMKAAPGGRAYGPLSVMLQALCEIEHLADVPPGCFWPPPAVHSSLVRITRSAEPVTQDPQRLRRLVHRLFTQRRKTLRRLLGSALPPEIPPTARPESLSVPTLVRLAEAVEPAGP
jgi:16S rRNA (adenine1518-N6/adenine1519-N6)-dimethyltransferase